jgi:uncharacterized coiled-coil protein SlyX
MSEDKTSDTLKLPTFEEKVLARLDAIDSRLTSLEKKVAARDYETKPIWERVLSELEQMRTDVNTHLSNFDRKLDVMNKELLQAKADQRGLESRIDKVESQVYPNVIVQDRQF